MPVCSSFKNVQMNPIEMTAVLWRIIVKSHWLSQEIVCTEILLENDGIRQSTTGRSYQNENTHVNSQKINVWFL